MDICKCIYCGEEFHFHQDFLYHQLDETCSGKVEIGTPQEAVDNEKGDKISSKQPEKIHRTAPAASAAIGVDETRRDRSELSRNADKVRTRNFSAPQQGILPVANLRINESAANLTRVTHHSGVVIRDRSPITPQRGHSTRLDALNQGSRSWPGHGAAFTRLRGLLNPNFQYVNMPGIDISQDPLEYSERELLVCGSSNPMWTESGKVQVTSQDSQTFLDNISLKYKCWKCRERFFTEDAREEHYTKCHKSESGKFHCNDCGKVFNSKGSLKKHELVAKHGCDVEEHQNIDSLVLANSPDGAMSFGAKKKVPSHTVTTRSRAECSNMRRSRSLSEPQSKTNKKFVNKSENRIDTLVPANSPDVARSTGAKNKKAPSHTVTSSSGAECSNTSRSRSFSEPQSKTNKTFVNKSPGVQNRICILLVTPPVGLRYSIIVTQTGSEAWYTCDICENSYFTAREVVRHRRKDHCCPYCTNNLFLNADYLARHIEDDHTCKKCGHQFSKNYKELHEKSKCTMRDTYLN